MTKRMQYAAFKSWLDTKENYHVICGYSPCFVRQELAFWLAELGGMAGVW